jgi:hypothetical protein
MFELEFNGYHPLSQEHLSRHVPAAPGVFILAIRLPNGVHRNFFTSQSDNLQMSLRRLLGDGRSQLPLSAQLCMEKFRTYFTWFVIVDREYHERFEKMLSQTLDPVVKLTVIKAA